MKKILFLFTLLISLSASAQVRICQLPTTTNGTPGDWLIKEDSSCVGTRKIRMSAFLAAYGLDSVVSSADTVSLSNRINSKVDTIYKNASRDSIVYTINGRRHAIKDSVGGGGGGLTRDSLYVVFNDVSDWGFSDPNDYPIGSIVYVLDTANLEVNNSSNRAEAFITRIIFDESGTNQIYDSVGSVIYNGKVCRAFSNDFAGGKVYLLDDAVFTVNAIRSLYVIGDFPNQYPIGTPIKIISGDTLLPSGVNYVLTHIVDSAGSKRIARNNVVAFKNGVEFTGTYDVRTNKLNVCATIELIASQAGTDDPTYTILKDETHQGITDFEYTSVGYYTLTTAYTPTLAIITVGQNAFDPASFVQAYTFGGNTFNVVTSQSGSNIDDVLLYNYIQIKLFP